jgi:hypothetical protein
MLNRSGDSGHPCLIPDFKGNGFSFSALSMMLAVGFSKEEIQMTKKHMETCSPSLAIKEMQIKTTLRFHLTPVRIAIIQNTTNNMCCEDVGKKRTLIHCW